MTESQDLSLAKNAYNTVIETLCKNDFPYEEHPDDLAITFKARGEDLPMDFVIQVESDTMQVRMVSQLPLRVPEDKRVDMALAICMVNDRLLAGCFDYDVRSENVYFRIENSYRDSPINTDLCLYMLNTSMFTVDEYNDKFFMIATNMASLEQFANLIKEEN